MNYCFIMAEKFVVRLTSLIFFFIGAIAPLLTTLHGQAGSHQSHQLHDAMTVAGGVAAVHYQRMAGDKTGVI